ncbi:hypothetical protein DERP_001320 [Dermatophagoides pteronyssinus]|uniref:Uncharacterized protein n=1 Tax=Dermatophagoides pteronyssinus TaxID=6956 RepID=A0ABQ8JE45_DERPT|nr:hypothetical protein DERP_001320 [Dermatophagoides pteronyssinus]
MKGNIFFLWKFISLIYLTKYIYDIAKKKIYAIDEDHGDGNGKRTENILKIPQKKEKNTRVPQNHGVVSIYI